MSRAVVRGCALRCNERSTCDSIRAEIYVVREENIQQSDRAIQIWDAHKSPVEMRLG